MLSDKRQMTVLPFELVRHHHFFPTGGSICLVISLFERHCATSRLFTRPFFLSPKFQIGHECWAATDDDDIHQHNIDFSIGRSTLIGVEFNKERDFRAISLTLIYATVKVND